MPGKRTYTEEEITSGLMAMIAWAGNINAAARYLMDEKDIKLDPRVLSGWKRTYAARFDEMREKYSGQMEANLVHELRDVGRLAVEGERLAIEKAIMRLRTGDDTDPGRTAANLARVTQSSVDKMLSVSGRPTQITETRGTQEIIRSLMAKGVLSLPVGTEETERDDS